MRTRSSMPWMVALLGPNSTSSDEMPARKRPSEVPPAVDSCRRDPGDRRDRLAQRLHQSTARREKRQASEHPLYVSVDVVPFEHLAGPRLERVSW